MSDAHCERMAGHPGPHCWRGPAEGVTMWTDGEPIVSPEGQWLVTVEDLTDSDGTVWQK